MNVPKILAKKDSSSRTGKKCFCYLKTNAISKQKNGDGIEDKRNIKIKSNESYLSHDCSVGRFQLHTPSPPVCRVNHHGS